MRVYIPATWPMLRKLVANERLDPVGGTAFALTPKLRESYTVGDDDELEYAAMSEAARASLRLLSVEFGLGEDSTPARRIVVAADLDDIALRPDLDDGAVRIRGPVELSSIAAVHVDTADADNGQVITGSEDAELVEHPVVGQVVLGVASDDLTSKQHAGAVLR